MRLSDASRIARNLGPAVRVAAPRVIRPARILWNQLLGVVFLLFAIPALWKAFQFSRTLATDPQSSGRLAITGIFGAVMLFFALSSFWRARRLTRSLQ